MRPKKGFTFIELLIALTIFSIIAAGVYFTLNTGIRMYYRGNVAIRNNQALRIFFDSISRDMRNAVLDIGKEPDLIIESVWETRSISFATIANVFDDDTGMLQREIVKVIYAFDENDGGLTRKLASKEEGFFDEFALAEVLLGELEGLRVEEVSFEYAHKIQGLEDEYEWLDTWETEDKRPRIPRGVKIRLTLINEETGAEEIFEKAVFIPIGRLGGEEEGIRIS